jgi:hypothetical protein
MKPTKKQKIIVGLFIALIPLIVALLNLFKTKSSNQIEQVNISSSKNNNSAPITITATNGSNAEVSIGDKTSLNQDLKSTNIITDERVISYGQQGGITARNVTIVNEKKIDFKTNFIVERYVLGASWQGKIGYKICPKGGVWARPFVAVKVEDDSVHASVSDLTGFCNTCGEMIIDYNNIKMKVLTYNNPIFPNTGILFAFDKMPSEIIFGDWNDIKQQYVLDFINMKTEYLYKKK